MDHAESAKQAGNDAYKDGNYREAIKEYTRAIVFNPSNATYYINRAAAFLMLKCEKEAIDDCMKALELDPKNVKAFGRCGKAYLNLGKLREAKEYIKKALVIEPTNSTLQADLQNVELVEKLLTEAKRLRDSGENTRALSVLDTLLAAAPEYTEAKLLKCRCLAALDRLDQIMAITRDVLMGDRSNTEALYLRGLVSYLQNELPKAKEMWREALRNDPDNSEVRTSLKRLNNMENSKQDANEAFSGARFAEAIDQYTKILELDPNNKLFNAQILCNRATANGKLGRHEQAVQDSTSAIDMNPGYQKAYVRRAESYSKLEQHEECVRDWEKLVELDGDSSEYKSNLRQAKIDLKRSKRKDYYKLLDVPKDATEDQIKRAYKLSAFKWHPDKNNESEETRLHAEHMFKEVGEAFSVLGNAEMKAKYDAGMDLEDIQSGGSGGFPGGGMDDLFAQMFAGGMGGGFGGFGGGMGGMGGGFGGMGGMPRGGGFRRGPQQHYHHHHGYGDDDDD